MIFGCEEKPPFLSTWKSGDRLYQPPALYATTVHDTRGAGTAMRALFNHSFIFREINEIERWMLGAVDSITSLTQKPLVLSISIKAEMNFGRKEKQKKNQQL